MPSFPTGYAMPRELRKALDEYIEFYNGASLEAGDEDAESVWEFFSASNNFYLKKQRIYDI